MEDGLMRYAIEAKVVIPEKLKIYSGFHAIGEFEVKRADSVLAIEESNLIFKGDSAFISLNNSGITKLKYVQIGLSDGINAQILNEEDFK